MATDSIRRASPRILRMPPLTRAALPSLRPESTTRSPSSAALPAEIILHIARNLDLPSALSFSLACARFAAAAQSSIWREVKLTAWADESLRQQMRRLLRQATPRHWELVRSLEARVTPDTLHSLIQIIDMASPYLTHLDIGADTSSGKAVNDLDVRLVNCGPYTDLLFPSLTSIRLHRVIRTFEFISYILQRSPQLISLDVDIDNTYYDPGDVDPDLALQRRLPARLQSNTLLRCLRFVYEGNIGVHSISDTLRARDFLSDVLARSPRLEQLSIEYERCWDDEIRAEDAFIDRFCVQPQVRDLHWRTSWVFGDLEGIDSPMLPDVRRLLLDFEWSTPIEKLPVLPSLEVIFFDILHATPLLHTVSSLPHTLPTLTLDPEIASWLRANPHLHIIHFSTCTKDNDSTAVFQNLDEVEKPGYPVTCRVNSVRHAGSELLRIEYLVQDISLAGHQWENVLYASSDASADRERGFARSELRVRHLAEWGGVAVPIEVLERMRTVEGISKAEWDRRGVEVGGEAWRVLTDWQAGVVGWECFSRGSTYTGRTMSAGLPR